MLTFDLPSIFRNIHAPRLSQVWNQNVLLAHGLRTTLVEWRNLRTIKSRIDALQTVYEALAILEPASYQIFTLAPFKIDCYQRRVAHTDG